MGLIVTTAAVVDAVPLADMKAWLHLDGNDEDATVHALVEAATGFYQNVTRRQLINTTFKMTADGWPSSNSWVSNPWGYAIRLPRSPLSSVVTVKYIDENGAQQTLATSVYEADVAVEPGVVRLKHGQSWPSVRWQKDSVEVNFVAGYGATADSVPEDHKTAIKLLAAHWFENREAVAAGVSMAALPIGLQALVQARRILEAA